MGAERMHDMEYYDFGKKEIFPKPTLDTPFDAMNAYAELQRSVGNLAQFASIRGRQDHFVKDLDTLQYALRDALFQSMVIREALTGKKTK